MKEKNKNKKNKNRLVKLKEYYNTLTIKEKRKLLKDLINGKTKLKMRLSEKQKIIDYLTNSIQKQEYINSIDNLTKDRVIEIKTEIVEKKTIIIECSGGLVDDVKGLPDGYDYDIHDYDNKGICKICGDELQEWEWHDHLISHNPNAKKLDWREINNFFDVGY